jgi:hypothetical protein
VIFFAFLGVGVICFVAGYDKGRHDAGKVWQGMLSHQLEAQKRFMADIYNHGKERTL